MLDTRMIEHNGVAYKIEIVADADARPDEADCYDAADLSAWRNDEWRFVGVVVTTKSGDASTALWGVEYGYSPGWGRDIDTDELITSYPVPDLIGDIARNSPDEAPPGPFRRSSTTPLS